MFIKKTLPIGQSFFSEIILAKSANKQLVVFFCLTELLNVNGLHALFTLND